MMISFRILGLSLLALLTASLGGGGCSRASSPPSAPAAASKPSPPAPQTTARIHWLGRDRLAAEANAAAFMAVWNLPASQKLEAQTLDKIALALGSLSHATGTLDNSADHGANTPTPPLSSADSNNHPSSSHSASALFRPLLEDLLRQEVFLEIRQLDSQPGETVLALRLETSRAALWESNVVSVLETFPGAKPLPSTAGSRTWALSGPRSSLQVPPSPAPSSEVPAAAHLSATAWQIDFARSGDWTLLGLAPGQNALLTDFATRIQRDQAPFPTPQTNYWIDLDLAPKQVAGGWGLPDCPLPLPSRLSFHAIGDGAWVHSSLTLPLPETLKIELDPWHVPTNFIGGFVSSFTAIRGIAPLLDSFKPWINLNAGSPPSQIFTWAVASLPMGTFFAALNPDATNMVAKLADVVLQKSASPPEANSPVRFIRPTNSVGLTWAGLPYVSPFLKTTNQDGYSYALGGFFVLADPTSPLPPELLQELQNRTNLVAYDWELTGTRITQWIYMAQAMRMMAGGMGAELPTLSSGLLWLKAIAPKLGPAGTEAFQTGPHQITLKRKSSLGFTAFELNLIADWLESPAFPHGLYSSFPHPDAPPAPVPAPRPSTARGPMPRPRPPTSPSRPPPPAQSSAH